MESFDLVNLLSNLIPYIVVLLLAISCHEAGHAWMSWKYGDDTAYMLGRVTLNPVAHTDPIGTLLIPILSFVLTFTTGAIVPLIGWGKPTPRPPHGPGIPGRRAGRMKRSGRPGKRWHNVYQRQTARDSLSGGAPAPSKLASGSENPC